MNRTDAVYPISLGMVQAFLLRGERAVLVDAGMPGHEARILKQIEAAGVARGDVGLIVITHVHADHCGALAALQAATGARVAVHRSEADLLRQGRSQVIVPTNAVGRLAVRVIPTPTQLAGVSPDVLIDDELDLAAWGVQGKVISTPGHTPGSLSVCLESGDAIIGDLLMGRFFRRGAPTMPFLATDPAQVYASVRRVLACRPIRIWAAHAGPWSPDALEKIKE